MSFFKDFKDDLSMAVNELLPGEGLENEDEMEESPDIMVNTLEGELDIESELSKLDGLLEHVEVKEEPRHVQVKPEMPAVEEAPRPKPQERRPSAAKKAKPPVPAAAPPRERSRAEHPADVALGRFARAQDLEKERAAQVHFSFDTQEDTQVQPPQEPAVDLPAEPVSLNNRNRKPNTTIKEEIPMNEDLMKESAGLVMEEELVADTQEVTDEVSIITPGTTIKGNLSTTGSFSINGRVEGNVQCNGKLEVTGTIIGNSSSSEVFSDAAKIEGEIASTGTVKIGLGSVVVGNISATSAVIAGAVKGDIDVQGPVVVDTSAVIVGNIKSRSVQINNGAVIEGFCSQCYADIDVDSLFGGENKKGK